MEYCSINNKKELSFETKLKDRVLKFNYVKPKGQWHRLYPNETEIITKHYMELKPNKLNGST